MKVVIIRNASNKVQIEHTASSWMDTHQNWFIDEIGRWHDIRFPVTFFDLESAVHETVAAFNLNEQCGGNMFRAEVV